MLPKSVFHQVSNLGYEERVAGGGLQEGEPEAAKLHHILEEGHHHLPEKHE